jgi:hypothetical protein
MELNLNGLPNYVNHVLGFSGEDGGFVKLNVVSQVMEASHLLPQETS